MRSRNVFDVWDDLFDNFQNIFDRVGMGGDSALSRVAELVDSSFPPCNVKVDKDKNLLIEFAIAGYKEDEINLSYEKNHLVVSIEPKTKEEDTKIYRVIRQGIKQGKATARVYVPSNLYDSSSVKAKFKNGILSITVDSLPESKSKSTSIAIST